MRSIRGLGSSSRTRVTFRSINLTSSIRVTLSFPAPAPAPAPASPHPCPDFSVCRQVQVARCRWALQGQDALVEIAPRFQTNWLQLWYLNPFMAHPDHASVLTGAAAISLLSRALSFRVPPFPPPPPPPPPQTPSPSLPLSLSLPLLFSLSLSPSPPLSPSRTLSCACHPPADARALSVRLRVYRVQRTSEEGMRLRARAEFISCQKYLQHFVDKRVRAGRCRQGGGAGCCRGRAVAHQRRPPLSPPVG